MNIRKIVRYLKNFLVPTPATVRRHRAPSARFSTLEALAATHGDCLTRDGRSYTLVTSDARVLEFDNLSQVKSYLAESTGLVATPDAVVAGNLCDHKTNAALGVGCIAPNSLVNVDNACAQSPSAVYERIFNTPPDESYKAAAAAPFVPVIVAPIVAPTTDITRD